MKKIIITGITGQDGSYLAEFLLNKKYMKNNILVFIPTYNENNITKLDKIFQIKTLVVMFLY